MFFTGKVKGQGGLVGHSDWTGPALNKIKIADEYNFLFKIKSELLNVMIDIANDNEADPIGRIADIIRDIDERGRI